MTNVVIVIVIRFFNILNDKTHPDYEQMYFTFMEELFAHTAIAIILLMRLIHRQLLLMISDKMLVNKALYRRTEGVSRTYGKGKCTLSYDHL
jgi:hypothetical protein